MHQYSLQYWAILGPNGERYIYLYYLFFPYTSDLLAIYTISDSQCTFEKQKHNCW